MNIRENLEKNLITIVAVCFTLLPAILEEIAKYVPVEYSSAFGLIIIIVSKFYQVNKYDTVSNEENIIANGDKRDPDIEGSIPLSPKYDVKPELEEKSDYDIKDLEEVEEEI